MTYEMWIDELLEAEEEMDRKAKRRKTRKANRIEREKRLLYTVNRALGAEAARFCKKMQHRHNRRNKESLDYNKKDQYRLKSYYWSIT